jgi:hypothetical protein
VCEKARSFWRHFRVRLKTLFGEDERWDGEKLDPFGDILQSAEDLFAKIKGRLHSFTGGLLPPSFSGHPPIYELYPVLES